MAGGLAAHPQWAEAWSLTAVTPCVFPGTVDGSFQLRQMVFEEEAGWEEFLLLQMARAVYGTGSFPWKD